MGGVGRKDICDSQPFIFFTHVLQVCFWVQRLEKLRCQLLEGLWVDGVEQPNSQGCSEGIICCIIEIFHFEPTYSSFFKKEKRRKKGETHLKMSILGFF